MKRFEESIRVLSQRRVDIKARLNSEYAARHASLKLKKFLADIEDAIKNLEDIREMWEINMKIDAIDKKIGGGG